MKQTAVEYIKEKLLSDEYWYENMTFEQIFEQAKEMENDQKIEFADEYGDYLLNGGMMSANSYMETFKSE